MPVELKHPDFPAPPPNAQIWRYSSFSKLLSLLTSQTLFMTSVAALVRDDPFEGSITLFNARLAERLREQPALSEEFFRGFPKFMRDHMIEQIAGGHFAQNRRVCFVSCWHASEHESAALWKLYSAQPDGIAIKSTIRSLADSVDSDREFILGKVTYHDYDAHFVPQGQVLLPIFMKRASFEHEKEVRLLYWGFGDWLDATEKRPPWVKGDLKFVEGRLEASGDFTTGLPMKCQTSTLIEEIVISPFSEHWQVETISETLQRLGCAAPVRRSALMDGPI